MKRLLPWFASLFIILVTFATTYAVVQQSQRSGANYPQVQIAQDTATALNRGGDPLILINNHVDFDNSLAPFVNVYDKAGNVANGSGYIDNKVAKAPKSLLEASKGKDTHEVTWEAEKDVRVAAVIVEAKDYYVLSGRNLKEVEKDIAHTTQLTLLGAMAAMALLALVYILSGLTAEEY
jgi:hypothetical protein